MTITQLIAKLEQELFEPAASTPAGRELTGYALGYDRGWRAGHDALALRTIERLRSFEQDEEAVTVKRLLVDQRIDLRVKERLIELAQIGMIGAGE
jgi:hypothetical protein